MIDLLIFDCDGTLVDTEHLHEAAVCTAFLRFGVDLNALGNFRTRFGGTVIRHIHQVAETETGVKIPYPLLLAEVHAYTGRLLSDGTSIQPVPGILAALAALPHPKCVASNGNRAVVMHSLHVTGLAASFAPLETRVFTACQVVRPKPFPELFLHAAAAHGLSADRCLVIEDSVAGVTAARAAGMPVIGYTGVSPLPDAAVHLRAAGAESVIPDYALLPALLENGNFSSFFDKRST